ncbi:formyltetrahydrofolate deformylase [Pseudonocardia lacus]|uniref:formyltetrahydrofolate deformylase n=1 Tax=Pseudonocardia lacus TaxID=2835865 RepID=UPI001BDBF6F4|nr:formyltetrahydrofolate deformylase [Pseudonocardia lacus]
MDPATERRYVVTLSCPDTTGIVARISAFLAADGGWITEAGYHSDPQTGWFFTRQVVRATSLPYDVAELRRRFATVAAELGGATWNVTDTGVPKRVVLLVSREAHCVHDLLGRVATGELPVRLAAVVGNHDDLGDIVRAHGVPFHHVPFPTNDAAGKADAFEKLADLVDAGNPDAVVLARFMQILPPELCRRWSGRVLNIHHSFLPSFVGARPYHQAYARGVKLIGATCHYVTADLDAGPIIEQDVIRVDHGDTASDMVRRGRDIERLVLARGLRWHVEDRVLVHGNKTVVFH